MTFLHDAPLVALAALLIEAAAGYPAALFARIGHPVTWIGALIAAMDRWLNRPVWSFARRRAAGVVALAILLGVVALVSVAITWTEDGRERGVALATQRLAMSPAGGP